APFDFYSNVVDATEQQENAAARKLGEPDIFFPGDDNNRNGDKASHRWTRAVAENFKGSIDFHDRTVQSHLVSFRIHFQRGPLEFHALIAARSAKRMDGTCRSVAYYCSLPVEHPDGSFACAKGGWTHQLLEVTAEAD